MEKESQKNRKGNRKSHVMAPRIFFLNLFGGAVWLYDFLNYLKKHFPAPNFEVFARKC